MKKLLAIFSLFFLGYSSVFAYSEYALLLKDEFGWSSSALMYTRESKTWDFGLYIIEYWLWCGLGMWRYEWSNVVVNTGKYGSFLDGISDTLILPKKSQYGSSYTCKIWDVKSLQEVFDDGDLEEDEITWLYDNGLLE